MATLGGKANVGTRWVVNRCRRKITFAKSSSSTDANDRCVQQFWGILKIVSNV